MNAWVYSPLLIAKPGTAASPRYETGLMHITGNRKALQCLAPQCDFTCCYRLICVFVCIVVSVAYHKPDMIPTLALGLGGVTPIAANCNINHIMTPIAANCNTNHTWFI